jgi:hypothetical protein
LEWADQEHRAIAFLCLERVRYAVQLTMDKLDLPALLEADLLRRDADIDKLLLYSKVIKQCYPEPVVPILPAEGAANPPGVNAGMGAGSEA